MGDWFAGAIPGRDVPGGIIGNIIAGFVGAWLGKLKLGSWGPDGFISFRSLFVHSTILIE